MVFLLNIRKKKVMIN